MTPSTRHAYTYPPRRLRVSRWIGRNLARLSYAVRVEPTWLEVNRWALGIDGLGPELDGFHIVQLSDLHFGKHLPRDYVAEAVGSALAEKPDLVVLTGDFVHKGFRHVEQAAESLAGLRAPHGVYAVLGNHDHSINNGLGVRRHRDLARQVADALTNRGIRVLSNEAVTLERNGDRLHLAGVDDLWSRRCDVGQALADLDADTPRVVLAHNPRTVEHLGGRRCDLMLSGHTHGGQVNLPRLGRVTLGKKARRFAAGFYQHHDTHLYVNKGVGFGWRLRYNVRPEVAAFRLHCRASLLCNTPARRV